MDVRLPDGTIIRGVPEGTSREDVLAFARANGVTIEEPKPEPSTMRKVGDAVAGGVRDAAAGAVRGAGSIGATLVDAVRSKLADPVLDVVPAGMRPDVTAGLATAPRGAALRSEMDAGLESLTGADTQSIPFQAGQMAGEVAGTLGAGGAVANALSRVPVVAQAVPGLLNAIRTGGMTTGVRAAPGFVPQAANLGTRVAGGAVHGGVAAGMVDPADAGTGALIQGAIPVATRVAGAAGRMVGNAVSPRMARTNATNKLVGTIGDDVGQTIADIQTYHPRGAENIPASAAAITKNPRLAGMEQGSRLSASPVWYEFDQRQGKAVYDNVLKATDEARELGARLGERAENWKQAWAKAAESQKPRIWQKRMTEFGANMETALRSPEASNPAVRGVLEAINAEFDRVGPAFSPAHLQQLRANLNGKVQPLSADVFKSAPRDNPAIKSLIAEMDDILNASTGGKWQKVLEGYAKDSDKVRASKAASKVRGSFVDESLRPTTKTTVDAAGDIPRITQSNLVGAIDGARLPDKSLALSKDASQRLEATLDVLRAQNIVQGLKRTATAGGGSDTIPNALASGVAQSAGAPNVLLQLIGATRKLGTAKTDNELAKLLANPDELAMVLEAFNRPVTPNRLASTLYRSVPAIAAGR